MRLTGADAAIHGPAMTGNLLHEIDRVNCAGPVMSGAAITSS